MEQRAKKMDTNQNAAFVAAAAAAATAKESERAAANIAAVAAAAAASSVEKTSFDEQGAPNVRSWNEVMGFTFSCFSCLDGYRFVDPYQ